MDTPTLNYATYITGSTTITFEMAQKVCWAVKRAHFRGSDILTGTHWGVERCVIEECEKLGITPYVFGKDKYAIDLPVQFIRFDGTGRELRVILSKLADEGVVIALRDDAKSARVADLFRVAHNPCQVSLCRAL